MSIEIGYALSSEEHGPRDLVRNAVRAEDLGFSFVSISDHFHPWVESQGHSPFVWSVLGGIAEATERIKVGTGVTCPIIRTHPGVIAHAAATTAAMMPGRFFLGLGSGEALNEHVFGDRWPPADVRIDMLDEAIQVIRLLWQGGNQDHHGRYYTVENARLFTLPDEPPPIVVAGGGERATQLAARAGDGYWNTGPDRELVEAYQSEGGRGPRYGQVTICWGEDEAEARKVALEQWPNTAVPGQLTQDLPTPFHFEQATKLVREQDIADAVPCGPDPEPVLAKVRAFAEAGFSHIYLHQIGPDQDGFFRFYDRELRSPLQKL